MKKSQVKFNSNALEKVIFDKLVKEQSRRLVAYAQETIQKIGAMVRSYHGKHNMDDTGNLLDSLCWGVSYKGTLVGSGFYREQQANKLSHLHAWFRETYADPVGGHYLASNFIKQMGNLYYNGWRVFFAIVAPYWGYWETGFTFRPLGNHNRSRYLKFAVMAQFYDTISSDLKPSKVTYTTKAPTYNTPELMKLYKRRDNRAGRGGYDMYSKYPRGKGKGQYDY